jgi:hypothetical protein
MPGVWPGNLEPAVYQGMEFHTLTIPRTNRLAPFSLPSANQGNPESRQVSGSRPVGYFLSAGPRITAIEVAALLYHPLGRVRPDWPADSPVQTRLSEVGPRAPQPSAPGGRSWSRAGGGRRCDGRIDGPVSFLPRGALRRPSLPPGRRSCIDSAAGVFCTKKGEPRHDQEGAALATEAALQTRRSW